MTEIRFYHLERQSVYDALPPLLNKARQKFDSILVQIADKSDLKPLSDHLWGHNPNNFLAHGLAQTEFEADQPILLTAQNDDTNPNNATCALFLNGTMRDDLAGFDLACIVFDGSDPDALSTARGQWKMLKDQDKTLTYWQQTDKGWEQKV